MLRWRTRSEPVTASPQAAKMRKANESDRILFVPDRNGRASYLKHLGHTATVIEVKTKRDELRAGVRATYIVACDCGTRLQPRSSAFSLVDS